MIGIPWNPVRFSEIHEVLWDLALGIWWHSVRFSAKNSVKFCEIDYKNFPEDLWGFEQGFPWYSVQGFPWDSMVSKNRFLSSNVCTLDLSRVIPWGLLRFNSEFPQTYSGRQSVQTELRNFILGIRPPGESTQDLIITKVYKIWHCEILWKSYPVWILCNIVYRYYI